MLQHVYMFNNVLPGESNADTNLHDMQIIIFLWTKPISILKALHTKFFKFCNKLYWDHGLYESESFLNLKQGL